MWINFLIAMGCLLALGAIGFVIAWVCIEPPKKGTDNVTTASGQQK